jgi:2-methylcitrate dehydratase PrpD
MDTVTAPGAAAATAPPAVAYRTAFLDWLACAHAGTSQPAARAARRVGNGMLERVAAAGTAGHVLDFDDTYLPGLAHLSAPAAPAALVLGAECFATVGEVLDAYAAGFEAMGALAEASHPALYDGGWHPTAVCGVVGAAAAAARLLELDAERERAAVRFALLRAGGLRAAFGSDGKSIQVGLAAAAGVQAARLAEAGATIGSDVPDGPAGYEEAFRANWAEPDDTRRVTGNWIKAYPCCLKAHSTIEAAAEGGAPDADLTVVVHPRARQAAWYDEVEDGLQAKFSIPYLTAYTVLHGPPTTPAAFDGVDAAAAALASERVSVVTDEELGEAEAVLLRDGEEAARVPFATGSPERPMTPERLTQKVTELDGEELLSVLDDPELPAADVARVANL